MRMRVLVKKTRKIMKVINKVKRMLGVAFLLSISNFTATADVFMDEAWAGKLCGAWNKNTDLSKP